jgi:hypothetical protein
MDLVGRKVGRDGGAAMTALIADMTAELDALTGADATLARGKAAAIEAVAALRNATKSLLEAWAKDADGALAVAVPYLELCGHAIGGWMMAKSQQLATQKSAADPEFYASKQQLCRYYLEHVLPECLALARIVDTGAASVTAADPALF